ncbi:Hypothetical predicted protein [Marmota monax]|uniref:Translationally-controlled tumor protein n=1 Tax=Marmota monax TaxID=9995 RepID=A0A5E4AWD9_MARMO|nr:hypothetical protein GHT09_003319 [Marmota monax]VTJ60872.1 Hypothetical predicted protein [Marmota monax]
MIIYLDLISHYEMFSDIYKIQEILDRLFLELEGKMVSRTEGNIDDSLIGGNASAERPKGKVPSRDLPRVSPIRRLKEQEETNRIIEMQRLEIRRLRDQIQEQEQVPGFHTIAGIRLPSMPDSDVNTMSK